MIAHAALDGRQRFEKREQVAQIVVAHMLIGRVGKRRIKMFAVRRDALGHGGDELRFAPAADAVLPVRRNIGNIECAERRIERQPAAKLGLVVLLGHRMAGRAAADIEHLLAIGEIGRVRRKRARRHRGRNGQHPERAKRQHGGDGRQHDQSLSHWHSPGAELGHVIQQTKRRRDGVANGAFRGSNLWPKAWKTDSPRAARGHKSTANNDHLSGVIVE